MYIPEFACGFIAGVVVGCAALLVIALIADKKDK